MKKILIKNITIVSEGETNINDVLIHGEYIYQIGQIEENSSMEVIDGSNKILLPGIIDAQVHFREPGLTSKGNFYTESKAAIAGGITSFIDMPNTIPNTLTMEDLAKKQQLASENSLANYGFLIGVNEENIDLICQINHDNILGVSDDGLYFSKKKNLLVENPSILERLFAECNNIISIHAESELIIEKNEEHFKAIFGDNIPHKYHPKIRSESACLEASKLAIDLALKHNARLHILHLSTEAETHLFNSAIPVKDKKITTEASIHHLWFSEKDYESLGAKIKWNPAIKTCNDKIGLLKAINDDRIDIITTDHAPHLLEEKIQPYFKSASGGPMVQHSLQIMLELYKNGLISLEKIVEKMCHNVALIYKIEQRGFIKEGYFADLVIVDLQEKTTINKESLLYKCGWSPLEGATLHSKITHTFVNGYLVYKDGIFDQKIRSKQLKKKNKVS